MKRSQEEVVSYGMPGPMMTRTLVIDSATDPSRMICKVTTALLWLQTLVAYQAYNAGLRASDKPGSLVL